MNDNSAACGLLADHPGRSHMRDRSQPDSAGLTEASLNLKISLYTLRKTIYRGHRAPYRRLQPKLVNVPCPSQEEEKCGQNSVSPALCGCRVSERGEDHPDGEVKAGLLSWRGLGFRPPSHNFLSLSLSGRARVPMEFQACQKLVIQSQSWKEPELLVQAPSLLTE